MVRYYGYYSNKSRGMRKKAGTDDHVPALIESAVSSTAFRKNWARLIQKIYQTAPTRATSLLTDSEVSNSSWAAPSVASSFCFSLTNVYPPNPNLLSELRGEIRPRKHSSFFIYLFIHLFQTKRHTNCPTLDPTGTVYFKTVGPDFRICFESTGIVYSFKELIRTDCAFLPFKASVSMRPTPFHCNRFGITETLCSPHRGCCANCFSYVPLSSECSVSI